MTTTITFLNTEFNSLNTREIKFNETDNIENDFKTILNLLPKFISKDWEMIETDNWQIQKHHLIETDFNFNLSLELKK